jgi:phenylacetate-CoA ligase
LDELAVRVEARPGAATAAERKRSADVLANRVKQSIGISVMVDVSEPGSIERSLGKARRILDLRDSK